MLTSSVRKSKPLKDAPLPQMEFKCLAGFTPLDEYLAELEKDTVVENEPTENKINNKSEWYKYAEELMKREKETKKPLPDVSFDELLAFWMKQQQG